MGMVSMASSKDLKQLDAFTDELNALLKKHGVKLYGGVLEVGHGDMEFRIRAFMNGCEFDITRDVNA